MTDRRKVDWSVPVGVWERFREEATDGFSRQDGSLGRETEAAMREYTDADGYAEVERKVRRLAKAAGRTPPGAEDQTKKFSAAPTGGPTTRVTVRVDAEVKEAFKKYVDRANAEASSAELRHTYGEALGRALAAYLDGGRRGRIERMLDDALPEAIEALGGEADADAEAPTSKPEKVREICRRLGPQFTAADLEGHIHDVAGHGAKASPPTVREYREEVLDRLDVVRHPFTDDEVWIPPSVLEEIVPEDVPEECVRQPEHLTREERIMRVIYAVGRRAAKQGNRARVGADAIREEILDGVVGRRAALSIMEEAAAFDGVTLEREGDHASLKLNLNLMAEAGPDDVKTILAYRDAGADPILGELTETTVSDFASDQQDGEGEADADLDPAADAEATMDRLDTGHPRQPTSADGGENDE